MDPFQNSLVPVAVQAAGLLMVAGLLRPLSRVTPGQFLSYWWVGWAVSAVGLAMLTLSFHVSTGATPLVIGYCLSQYVFGVMIWAGCRNLAHGTRIFDSRPLRAVPLVLAAVFGPLLFSDIEILFPFHAVIIGGLFVLSLIALHPISNHSDHHPAVGLWLTRASLLGLVILFWHFAALFAYIGYFNEVFSVQYMQYWTLCDMLLEIGLAFGMVVVASDRVRQELENRNRQLADATAELARAARTDPLTGLLNRRALEAMLPGSPDEPFVGCLAMIDLNDLKPLNDRFGHQTGDAALQVTARALRTFFRVTDPLFRMGGDEFLVLLFGGTEAELIERMNKVDLSLLGARLPGCEDGIDLKIAWGVATFTSAANFWDAIRLADAEMYRAKSNYKRAATS